MPTTAATPAMPAAGAGADVTVSQCRVDPDDDMLADVGGTLRNHDQRTDDYGITVTIMEGSTRVGEAEDVANDVAAGQTWTWSANGIISGGTTAGLTCRLASVSRTPAD